MNALNKALQDFTIDELDVDRDWVDVERLLVSEEWPFVRADLEVSHSQDRSIGLIGRYGDKVNSFFTIHNFGDIAYLDMIIIDTEARQNPALAKSLWRRASEEMNKKGFTAKVAHCTNDSGPMLRFLGYQPGNSFTLLRKDATGAAGSNSALTQLTMADLPALIELDATVFGMPRESWLSTLMTQDSTLLFGRYAGEELKASLCLRERRENSLCIDSCNGLAFPDLLPLLDDVLGAFAHKRLECFVKTDSDLHEYLLAQGFHIPDFFTPIGPLVEYTQGSTNQVGNGPHMRTLSWI